MEISKVLKSEGIDTELFFLGVKVIDGHMSETTLYVTAPLLKPALRRGLTLAAATCVGEFAATLFLARPEW